jgi:TonB-linked SusC/RagA family outer membrane protein
MKKIRNGKSIPGVDVNEILLKMKLLTLMIFIAFVSASASSYSQATKFNLDMKDVTIGEVFQKIEEQSEFVILFNEKTLNVNRKVDVNVKDKTVETILDQVFNGDKEAYRIFDKQIAIYPNEIKELTSLIKAVSDAEQKRVISGTVKDSKGLPLSGVTVVAKGTTTGMITDANGQFKLNIPANTKTLVFSFVGMKSQEANIAGQKIIDIKMEDEISQMGEVVVVAYGTQNRANVTGSITQLSASKLEGMPVGQFAQQLQGQIAGVNANINTGKPGQGMEIQVRGAISINAGNYPLIVVDGQPLSAVQGQNPINNINPDEIESFTVLKDASASALYGSRAASGVILITTKQAKKGKMKIDFNSYYGMASLDESHVPQIMNANQLATFMKAFFEDKIKYENYINPLTNTPTVPAEYQDPSQYGEGTNWIREIMRVAPIQNYSISLSDAREKSSTSVVASYFNQQGIVRNTGYERYTLRVNNEFRPSNKIKIGFNVAPSYQIDHNSLGGNTDGSRQIVQGALLSSPLIAPYDSDGKPVNQASGFFLLAQPNWRLVADNMNDIYKTARVLGNSYIQVDLLKGLTLKTCADVDVSGITRNRFVNNIVSAGLGAPPPRPNNTISGIYSTDNYVSWVNENTINYKTTINDHHLEALAGYTIQNFQAFNNSANGSNYPDASIPYISAAATTTGTSGNTEWALLSYIGRVNYNYKDKYLLSGAIRRDGSSKFGENKRFGVFPSISAGWTLTKESFMKNLHQINDLKIRASYGLTGNNNFNSGNYPSASLVGPVNYVFSNALVSGKYVTQLGNSDLTWEKNKQFDLGVDIGILNNRITFIYDYYNKETDGLLYQVNIPQSSGFSSVSSNIGTFKFWGHEFTMNSYNLTGTFKWNTSFNITFNRNLIKKLGTQNLPILPANVYSWPNIQMVGQPIGMFYGYVTDGVYMNQAEFDSQPKDVTSKVGSVRMKDISGPAGVPDGKITTDDRQIIGNPNPDFLFGMTNNFSYKQFDLNVIVAGSYGGQIADPLQGQDGKNLDGAFNLYTSELNHWRSESDPGNGKVPSTRAGTTALYRTFNTNSVYPGSYLACKNIQLGYSFKLNSNSWFTKLRIYCSVQQAFVITKYPGFSPETNNQGSSNLNGLNIGVDGNQYPIPRTISFGVNVNL